MDENKEQQEAKNEQTSGDQAAGGDAGMDRHEGQTMNGTIGGTGSDLDQAAEKLGAAGTGVGNG